MPDVSPFLSAVDDIAHGCALENIAVIRCCGVAHRVFLAAVASGKHQDAAQTEGAEAYRRSMPPLDTQENIRNFISRVAHAMLIRIIPAGEAPRLLYAAQCALGAVPKTPIGRSMKPGPEL